jgi:hypothetical protein
VIGGFNATWTKTINPSSNDGREILLLKRMVRVNSLSVMVGHGRASSHGRPEREN